MILLKFKKKINKIKLFIKLKNEMKYKLHPNTLNHLQNAIYVKSLGKGGYGNVHLIECNCTLPATQAEASFSSRGYAFCVKGMKKTSNIQCNKLYAIKQFKCNKNNEKHRKKYLLNEYTIGTLLNHNNIRKTLDIDFTNNSLIFEYCPGIDFLTYLNQNQVFDEKKNFFLIHFFKEFINGVEYMHNIGIAHMDLKLENIMIDVDKKTVKIIDLGEARVFHDTHHIHSIIEEHGVHGTGPYIAPEEFITNNYYNPEKTDIWSCGIILYNIIYLHIPWQKAILTDNTFCDFLHYFQRKMLNPKLFNKHIGDHLFLKMLNPNPSNRCNITDIKKDINEEFCYRFLN